MSEDGIKEVTGSQQAKMNQRDAAQLPPLAPLIPPGIRGEIRAGLLTPKRTMIETAEDIRARYRDGEFAVECEAGDFGHLKHWTLADWRLMCKKVKAKIPTDEWNRAHAPVIVSPAEARPVLAAAREAAKVSKAMAKRIAEEETRAAAIKAEQEAIAAIKAAETPAEEEADAQARLELLRRKIKAKLSVDEEAEILVGLARGDNAAMARAALAQIQEILGVKAANVPETPGMASIFAFPEGVTGPAIR